MNSRALSTLVAAVFVLIGATFIGLRYHVRQENLEAEQDSLWKLSYSFTFGADNSGAELQIALPFDTPHCELVKEVFTPGPDLRTRGPLPLSLTRTRVYTVTTRRGGKDFQVDATIDLRLSPKAMSGRQPPLESLDADARARFTREEESIPTLSESVRSVIQKAPEDATTRSQTLQWLFEYCTKDIQTTKVDATDDPEVALQTGKGSPLAKVRAFVALCRAMKFPARIVTGFEIEQQRELEPRLWVEVFLKQSWIPFDPVTGYARYLPMNYLPVRRGGDSIYRATGAADVQAQYSLTPLPPSAEFLQSEIKHPLQILDLTRLPLPMHKVMKVLLLLPLAAFIVAIMRNVVGIRTFGTFSPALLALSFIYADWVTGLLILIIVMTMGLTGRTFLERLHLLMVPRLSIILTIVVLCVVFGVSLLDYSGRTLSSQAVLLPMVILTNLIERFHVSREEDGAIYTFQLAIGTLVVAVLCYLTLRWEDVGQFILIYPEAHFFTIAAFIALGRYAGYRLTELWRFSDLVD